MTPVCHSPLPLTSLFSKVVNLTKPLGKGVGRGAGRAIERDGNGVVVGAELVGVSVGSGVIVGRGEIVGVMLGSGVGVGVGSGFDLNVM